MDTKEQAKRLQPTAAQEQAAKDEKTEGERLMEQAVARAKKARASRP